MSSRTKQEACKFFGTKRGCNRLDCRFAHTGTPVQRPDYVFQHGYKPQVVPQPYILRKQEDLPSEGEKKQEYDFREKRNKLCEYGPYSRKFIASACTVLNGILLNPLIKLCAEYIVEPKNILDPLAPYSYGYTSHTMKLGECSHCLKTSEVFWLCVTLFESSLYWKDGEYWCHAICDDCINTATSRGRRMGVVDNLQWNKRYYQLHPTVNCNEPVRYNISADGTLEPLNASTMWRFMCVNNETRFLLTGKAACVDKNDDNRIVIPFCDAFKQMI